MESKITGRARDSSGSAQRAIVPAAGAGAGSTGQDKAGRSRESKALAKLRSLLKVREGELAMIRIPARLEDARSEDSSVVPPGEVDLPTISHVANIEQFCKDLEAGVSQEDLIEGAVKAAEGSFEWRSTDLEIKGQGLVNSNEETTLMLNLRLGNTEMVTTFTAKVGSMFVIYPAGGVGDSVLMVVGGQGAADSP
ncbi:hypothetical protein [Luteolibacter luteus]|uniref:Uncharacterized protein n=1 Tax=Luteolibacter luteus TaxID=2728835 RepID=A0A858RIU4_9BACT|nr:hypothetical protein [Luteolibacter luteus]QJE97156.1 hypothetical protein HHL09_15615 [Luteolibacter luteus]